MGALLGILIILLMLFVLGTDIHIIIGIILGILGLAVLFMLIFFLFCAVILMSSEKREAVFSRIGKSPRGNFDCAYYMVDGQEYPNAFPCEPVLRDKLYQTSGSATVRLSSGMKFVFDKKAMITFAAGLPASIILCAAGIILLIVL